ncbi:MAG: 4-hydroxy-tetrahydrodipicolinate synthase [Bauldia sp.]|nr:4-hydroxy-tetrahydrodipicolinate synthase [Bauldia sp.]
MNEPHSPFAGVFTALVTPFRDGAVDLAAFDRLVELQIAAGVAGLVPVGTTGEAATLAPAEADLVVRRTVEIASGRAFVLAGAGSNATARTIESVRSAEALGVDGCLLVTPYYNRPTQEGLYLHYAAIAGATSLPLVLYSVPGRTGVEIATETVERLARRFANIVAMKESGGRVERVTALRRVVPRDFAIHCGDDLLTLPFLALGAVGVTSVVSNYAPVETVALVEACQRGDRATALELHEALAPLIEALFVETSPGPVKAALARRGFMTPDLRLPLAPLAEASRAGLFGALDRFEAARLTGGGLQITAQVAGDR